MKKLFDDKEEAKKTIDVANDNVFEIIEFVKKEDNIAMCCRAKHPDPVTIPI